MASRRSRDCGGCHLSTWLDFAIHPAGSLDNAGICRGSPTPHGNNLWSTKQVFKPSKRFLLTAEGFFYHYLTSESRFFIESLVFTPFQLLCQLSDCITPGFYA